MSYDRIQFSYDRFSYDEPMPSPLRICHKLLVSMLEYNSRRSQADPLPPLVQDVPPPSQADPLPVEDEDFGDDIPQDFVCPLSLSIMKEPVMASDGHTYEKEKIQTWMRQKKISPISRAELLPHFFPNLLLKNQIDDWKKAYRKARTDAEVDGSV